jgi:hypothetical protein
MTDGAALTLANEKRHAIIILPAGGAANISRKSHRRLLSRGAVTYQKPVEEMLNRVLPLVRHEKVTSGLAALRFWGQTNERAGVWMAAADPVYLETMVNNLRLNAISADDCKRQELGCIYDGLQQALGGRNSAFARIRSCGYLRGNDEIATAAVSAQIADGVVADEFMPPERTAASYHLLMSEIQMYLHEHDVNKRREAQGKRPINGLWIWGGGVAPEKNARLIPPLFGDDPLFRGYWESCSGAYADWDGDLDRCRELAQGEFVVVMPNVGQETASSEIAGCLDDLMAQFRKGGLYSARLLFTDGLSVDLGHHDWLKFWRRDSPLLTGQLPHG